MINKKCALEERDIGCLNGTSQRASPSSGRCRYECITASCVILTERGEIEQNVVERKLECQSGVHSELGQIKLVFCFNKLGNVIYDFEFEEPRGLH